MATDAERREVARRLREWTWKSAPPECLLNQLVFGDDCPGTDDDPDTIDCHQCEVIAAKRLADLIEPSCDRDALLALAGCVRKMGEDYDKLSAFGLGTTFCAIADRIRDALGASDGQEP